MEVMCTLSGMLGSGVVGAWRAYARLGLLQVWVLALALHMVSLLLRGRGKPRRKAGFTVTLVKTLPISEPVLPLKSSSPRT